MKRCLLCLVFLSLMITLDLCATAQSVPQIVAQVSLTGQTGNIKYTPLYTPPSAGLFRVTTHTIITTAVNNTHTALATFVKWTDETGHTELYEGLGLPVDGRPPYATQTATFTFEAAASQPVEYSVDGAGQGAGVVYSLYITVEQLQ